MTVDQNSEVAGTDARELRCGDPVDRLGRADDQAVADNRRGGHREFVEVVLADDLKLGASVYDVGGAFLAQSKNLSVVRPGRRGKSFTDTLTSAAVRILAARGGVGTRFQLPKSM